MGVGGRGLRRQGTEEHGNIQQDFNQPQQANTGPLWPRDPTACWKEVFPKGNRGRSSSFSRTKKLEKANGLVWPAPCGSDQTSAETGPEGRKLEPQSDSLQWAGLSPTPLAGHWPSLGALHRHWWLAVWESPE